MDRRGSLVTAAAPAIFALLLPACSSTDWTTAAEKSIAWTTKTEAQASLFVLLYGSVTLAPAGSGTLGVASSEDYAVSAAGDVATRLGPCVSSTTVSTKDTYTFTKCGGARGLAAIDGAVVAAYRLDDINGDMIEVAFGGQGVSLGENKLDLALAGGNAFPATTWSSMEGNRRAFHLADTAPPATNTENRDALLALTGDFGDHGCGDPVGKEPSPAGITAAHGFASVDAGEAWTIDATAYHRCAGGCPAAGATIVVELGEKVSVAFDGTATAHAENLTTGDRMDLALTCTP